MLSGPCALPLLTWVIATVSSLTLNGDDRKPSALRELHSLLHSCFTDRTCFLSDTLHFPLSMSWWAIEFAVTGFWVGAAACKAIECFPCHSARVSEVYTLDGFFPPLSALRIETIHKRSSSSRRLFAEARNASYNWLHSSSQDGMYKSR